MIFFHVHKVLSNSQGLKVKNDYYYGPFNQRSEEELRKRIFLIRQFFLSKMTFKDWKLWGKKKASAPHCPQYLLISLTIIHTNVSYFEKKSEYFFYLGKISYFDNFWLSKKASKWDNLPKSKIHSDFFQNMRLQYLYLLEISSNIGGNRGHLLFLP